VALQWTSVLSVGVPELDAQHEELFARVDRLLDAMLRHDRSEAIRLLGFLREYVVVHFEVEERLMVESGFPNAACHIDEHRNFAATLRAIDADYRETGATPGFVLRLEKEAVAWLADHVAFTDVALGRWIQSIRPAARARLA
jgi:hemerythrin